METVKVRIAVVVDEHGKWAAHGYDGARDDAAMDGAYDGLDSGAPAREYWVEADLPIPGAVAVQGTVVPSSNT